jgi:hypothetical protein
MRWHSQRARSFALLLRTCCLKCSFIAMTALAYRSRWCWDWYWHSLLAAWKRWRTLGMTGMKGSTWIMLAMQIMPITPATQIMPLTITDLHFSFPRN